LTDETLVKNSRSSDETMEEKRIRVHPTADVSPGAQIGEGTSIWNLARVREGAMIGEGCILGTGAYVDSDKSPPNCRRVTRCTDR